MLELDGVSMGTTFIWQTKMIEKKDRDFARKISHNGHIRNRTGDLFLAREARYQLRHVPIPCIL